MFRSKDFTCILQIMILFLGTGGQCQITLPFQNRWLFSSLTKTERYSWVDILKVTSSCRLYTCDWNATVQNLVVLITLARLAGAPK